MTANPDLPAGVAAPSEHAGPQVSPGFLLWSVTLRWQRQVTADLRPLGLTHVQFVLLATVWWLTSTGQRPSQRQIAGHARTDPMMTSQVLRTLEGRGLLERHDDPADARKRQLALTETGRSLVEQAIRAVEAVDRQFFAAADRGTLLHTLQLLAGADQEGSQQ